MFDFLKKKKRKQNKELDAAIRKILMNMENNYKMQHRLTLGSLKNYCANWSRVAD